MINKKTNYCCMKFIPQGRVLGRNCIDVQIIRVGKQYDVTVRVNGSVCLASLSRICTPEEGGKWRTKCTGFAVESERSLQSTADAHPGKQSCLYPDPSFGIRIMVIAYLSHKAFVSCEIAIVEELTGYELWTNMRGHCWYCSCCKQSKLAPSTNTMV